MPDFASQKQVITNVPVITVDAGLKPGQYLFRLVVVDEAGNQSEPSELIVTITQKPR